VIVAGCLVLTLPLVRAQNTSAANSAEAARAVLAEKARALEARGRPDMAIQLWQQILLSTPNNTDALAAMARDYKLIGSNDLANQTLERLRAINPSDPNIARIEAMVSTSTESQQLSHAGELTRAGRNEDAMRIYRQLYGDQPPNGDIALAYYQTLYGTASGKQAAIAGMRELVDRNPGDPRYAVALGTMLTYDQHTRGEGIRILQAHPADSGAQAALRQALIWDSANPASAAELREFLKSHPQDTEVAAHLKENEAKLAQINSGIARTPAERAAFAALNARRLDEAEKRFTDLLEKEPNNGRVEAGMGFLRMRQQDFGSAITYFTQAEQNGYKAKIVADALATSRFWFTMSEATQAFGQNQLDVAAAKYRDALDMNSRSIEALNGLAGVYIREQQYTTAATVYTQLIKLQPASFDGWRGLFLAYAQADEKANAFAVMARFPASVRASLNRDPEYLRTLAAIYQAQGRTADAERVLALALALPFPDNGSTLKADTKMQYAGILMEARRFSPAAALYSQVVTADPTNVSAWMGLVSAHHELGQDAQAIDDVQRIPADTYEKVLSDPGFLAELGAIYQHANQFEVAQGMLERAEKLDIAAGRQPSVSVELQLAGIDLLRNNTDQAYTIYRKVLTSHSDNADAWKGLISTLAATNRNGQALEEIAQIPAPVRMQLDSDIDFIQTEASLYAASGDTARAIQYMSRVQAFYAKLKQPLPPNLDIQNAWLLYNVGNDRALYSALMRIGGRTDLSLAEREMVQNIWANWSVRRAAAAMDNGYAQHAVDILDAASQAFPNNLAVRKAVAGGYARVGRAKEALAVYKTVPMQDATAGDFEGAVGAALAANDKNQAELWLRQALERFPRDPAVLSLAARYEQAIGDNERAADYYRASLAAMPPVSPVDRLAHVLDYPDQDLKAHRAVTAADLQRLLDPDYEPFPRTTKLPPLPAYGPDPYGGRTPVVLPPAQPSPQIAPASSTPSDTQDLPPPPPQSLLAPAPSRVAPPLEGAGAFRPLESGSRFFRPLGPDVFEPSKFSFAATDRPRLEGYGLQPVHQRAWRKSVALAPERSIPSTSPARFCVSSPHLVFASVTLNRTAHAFRPALQSSDEPATQTGLTLNPPHSLASDAWKGLVFSLMAANRNAEALEELNKIPAGVRQLLEADIEWVQGVASLYVAVGDVPHATYYVKRVENYYLLHRAQAPAGLEVQHAWLLYNIKDDASLYPVLMRLDDRQDLTAGERQQEQTLWAVWAVRRANQAMDSGNLLRGVEILEAALQDYPGNLGVRFAIAGAYARMGRAVDALALYKSIPMNGVGPSEFQGAIGAALAARDMAQAEIWLRVALNRFPNDPNILGLAAQFEQARGNNQRASEFWRAALALIPPGSTLQTLGSGLASPPDSWRAPGPGESRRLLDPSLDPKLDAHPTNEQLAPLPSYKSQTSGPPPIATTFPPASAQPQISAPSSNPLPLPFEPSNPEYEPAGQGIAPSGPPVYAPEGAGRNNAHTPPVFVAPSNKRQALIKPAENGAPSGTLPLPAPLTGTVILPPSEENITSTGPAEAENSLPPQPDRNAQSSTPSADLRIASQPMNDVAAHAQALLAEETDSQLTQGSASLIHPVPNAPVSAPANAAANAPSNADVDQEEPTVKPALPAQGYYDVAQNTPSAQDAASGAYSAPQQPQSTPPQPAATPATPPATPTSACPPARPAPCATTPTHKHPRKPAHQSAQPPAQTLGNAPIVGNPPESSTPAGQSNPPAEAQQPTETPQQTPSESTTGTGLTDEELEQRNLPPLHGPWVRVQRQAPPLSPREQAEEQLQAIESGYSGWLGGTSLVNVRNGAPGYDQLAAIESPFEASAPIGYHARITAIAKPVFLDSGQANGTANLSVIESQSGATCLVTIPEPIGTYVASQNFTPCTSPSLGALTPPAQQNAFGLGGELQLAFPHLMVAGGYTPFNFLVSTFTARFQWKPANGPVTFSLVRDSEKDSQLSYAGLRDPAGNTLSTLGQIWGGVVYNQGQVQVAHGDAESGFYFSASGQYLTGYNVEKNDRVDGTGGAYWRVFASPELGNLTVGANFFAMHYANNQNAFTHGMGGYFSPQAYFLGNVPFSWAGHYETHWHYNIVGALGVQAFQEESTPLFPLAGDKPLETSQNNPMLPAVTSVSANYDLRSQVAYQIGPHWFAGAYLAANNTRNYTFTSVGFFVRFMFREQPSTAAAPTGLFPADGPRPFTVP
jgi:tetratricopeptide (TPR) repeat protein